MLVTIGKSQLAVHIKASKKPRIKMLMKLTPAYSVVIVIMSNKLTCLSLIVTTSSTLTGKARVRVWLATKIGIYLLRKNRLRQKCPLSTNTLAFYKNLIFTKKCLGCFLYYKIF
jgi:hypothetical protein